MKKLFFAATVVAVTLATQGADDMSARLDALLATSNLWGTTVAEYGAALGAALRPLKGQADAQRRWFVAMCGYDEFPSGTNDVSWLREKRRMVWLCLPRKAIVSSTNCWLAAASYLRRLKEQDIPELQELEGLIRPESVVQLQINDTASENLKAYLASRADGINASFAMHRSIRSAISQIVHAVTNDFPCAILPTIPAAERFSIISNVAERARLTTVERATIEAEGSGDGN